MSPPWMTALQWTALRMQFRESRQSDLHTGQTKSYNHNSNLSCDHCSKRSNNRCSERNYRPSNKHNRSSHCNCKRNDPFRNSTIYELPWSRDRYYYKESKCQEVNILIKTTNRTETNVSDIIEQGVNNSKGAIEGYDTQSRCDFYGCKKDRGDDCDSGVQCECKDGFQRPNPQMAFCIALDCPNCNREDKKQCLLRADGGGSECVCLAGYQSMDDGKCVECPFGYSGVNCTDQFQLILTIVGSIAGIIILGMVIAFIVTRVKNKRKDDEEENLIEKDSPRLKLQQTEFTNFGANESGTIFPKIKTVSNQPQNPYVSHGGMPRPDY
ncbi:mucin-13 [Echinops telfairi]|uniref:Mucin-13 n=1 Tax=Echinops telfairi TaxID=9371 RepID=A0AC55CVE9_ECHTE|nr:mucin-13 [Echinops telfairi]